jgi:hypothetical protein
MSMRINLMTYAATLILASGTALAAVDHPVKSPADVKAALGTLNRVVDHTQRLITAKNYGQLPHENEEFKEGSDALQKAVTAEPASFKQQVDPLLQKANMASNDIAAAAKDHNDAKLMRSHAELEGTMKDILAAFPKDVQPPPPNVTQEKAEERTRQ